MATPFDPKNLITLEELTLSNMWEVTVLTQRKSYTDQYTQ